MLNDIFQRIDVQEHVVNITNSIRNTCNNGNAISFDNKNRELSTQESVTAKSGLLVAAVTEKAVQLTLIDTPLPEPHNENPVPWKCNWCGSTDFWKSSSRRICRRCHPPAPGAERRADSN